MEEINIYNFPIEQLECFADHIYVVYNRANMPTMVVANLEIQRHYGIERKIWTTRRAFAREHFNEDQEIHEKTMYRNDDYDYVARKCFNDISGLMKWKWNEKGGNRSIKIKNLFDASEDGLLTLSDNFRRQLGSFDVVLIYNNQIYV
jgi:hypothetical protein